MKGGKSLRIRSTGPIAAGRHLGYKSLAQIPARLNKPVSSNVSRQNPPPAVHLAMLANAKESVVESSKVRDYLLSPSHPIGRFKSVVFSALGYTQDEWHILRDDLLELVVTAQAKPGQFSEYGQKYEVSGQLVGPSGRSAYFTTVWIVRPGETAPGFITAFPG